MDNLKFERSDFQDTFRKFDSVVNGFTGDISDILADEAALLAQAKFNEWATQFPVNFKLETDGSVSVKPK